MPTPERVSGELTLALVVLLHTCTHCEASLSSSDHFTRAAVVDSTARRRRREGGREGGREEGCM